MSAIPVRLKITIGFTLLFTLILGSICLSIACVASLLRRENVQTRLRHRAITTANLLSYDGRFDRTLMQHVDSLTTSVLKRKTIQAYNRDNELVYFYSELPQDSFPITPALLAAARSRENDYFTSGEREALAFCNTNDGLLVLCVCKDEYGLQNLRKLNYILFWGVIGGGLLSFAGGYLFSARLLKPVREIAKEVKDISARNLDRRIPEGRAKDEWQLLSTTLNELLDRLKDSFELQRRFVSNASHELSTPLTIISSQLEITLQRTRTEEAYKAAMTQVLKDVRYMRGLVQTLLQFATASGDPGGLHIDLIRIDEILMRLPGDLRARDPKNKVTFHFDELPEDDEQLLVLGNEELLFTAIVNIVSNACRYSDDHHAEVSLGLKDGRFLVRVKDNGIGIEDKELQHIFRPFYRIHPESDRKGFGLGLALASRIIYLHKGDITVTSAPGAGTTFTVTLPAGNPN